MTTVRFLQTVATKSRTIEAGTVINIPVSSLAKLADKVAVLTVSTVSTCQITGDVCQITYTPDLYQEHRHRDGETITVDGVSLRLQIKEIVP